jgi:hypothetical protein
MLKQIYSLKILELTEYRYTFIESGNPDRK